ncbi:(2,3-dihydroxybenzoyl)adenylate synthase [Microbulbifer thermotolerans]|nr:(2,3-dihydroxybenzoyl)adenylate synthase [Microbulbifer thermotolerans]MCX2832738.1 (2,3-dihydroxybenzoyl)adenylate synthase [Microbulbifer thermotolerans]MCX2842970.1 (2,3-dihydroxybenzoyl)adenylate synthase [Microbulbifer thermotolerans]
MTTEAMGAISAIEYTQWPEELQRRYRQSGYWIDRPLTDLIQGSDSAKNVAVICGERAFTYADLDRLSSHLAAELGQRGLCRGQTALVQLPNIAEFYIVFFALLKLGVAPVNALFSHQQLELNAYAEQLQPTLVIGSARHKLFRSADFTEQLKKKFPQVHVLVLGATDYTDDLEQCLHSPEGHAGRAFCSPSAAHQVAFFQLSGGSTGTPKLIPRTHNDYYYSVRRSAEICRLSSHTRYLCALPAPHNFPLSSPGALGVFHAGGTVILAESTEPGQCFALVQRHGVTMAALVPSAVNLWLSAAERAQARGEKPLNSLQLLQVGGANFAETVARRVPTVLGCRLQQVFGMAEGLVNYTRLDDSDEKIFTTQGRPMSDGDEVRVLDEKGNPVTVGQPGLLYTRGPYTFRGYYKAPQQNARVFDKEGFYCSGDIVQQDEDGYLRVVGRVKDQINRGGEKIAAEEVENLLLKHGDIEQVGLIALQDANLGEKSCACIVTRNAKLKPVQLRRFLREQGLADYKIPDRFQFLKALPLTAVGKIDKVALRAQVGRRLLAEEAI